MAVELVVRSSCVGPFQGHVGQDAARRYPQEGAGAPSPGSVDRRQFQHARCPHVTGAGEFLRVAGDPGRRIPPCVTAKTVIGHEGVIDAAQLGATGRNTHPRPLHRPRTTVQARRPGRRLASGPERGPGTRSGSRRRQVTCSTTVAPVGTNHPGIGGRGGIRPARSRRSGQARLSASMKLRKRDALLRVFVAPMPLVAGGLHHQFRHGNGLLLEQKRQRKKAPKTTRMTSGTTVQVTSILVIGGVNLPAWDWRARCGARSPRAAAR